LESKDAKARYQLWKTGESIDKAAFKFANSELVNEYHGYFNALNQNTDSFGEFKSDGLAGLGQISQKLTQSNHLSRQINYALDEIRKDTLKQLMEEKIIGLGFQPPINTASSPEAIPLHVWPKFVSDINWDNSSFSLNGIEFLNIKITSINEFKTTISVQKPNVNRLNISNKQTGRPNMGTMLFEIFENLKSEGLLSPEYTLSSYTPEFQIRAKQINPTQP
jgi:hypothetical protein